MVADRMVRLAQLIGIPMLAFRCAAQCDFDVFDKMAADLFKLTTISVASVNKISNNTGLVFMRNSSTSVDLSNSGLQTSVNISDNDIPFTNSNGQVKGGPASASPEQLDQLISSECENKKSLLVDLRVFSSDCIRGMAQSLVMVFLEGVEEELNVRCARTGQGRANFTELANCTSSTAVFDQCNIALTRGLENAQNMPLRRKMPTACCAMSSFSICVLSGFSECSPAAQEYVRFALNAYAGDILDAICLRYQPGSALCAPPQVVQLANVTAQTTASPRNAGNSRPVSVGTSTTVRNLTGLVVQSEVQRTSVPSKGEQAPTRSRQRHNRFASFLAATIPLMHSIG